MKQSSPSLVVPLWLILTAVGLMLLPREVQARIRLAVGDCMKPGCLAVHSLNRRISTAVSMWRKSGDEDESELQRLRQKLAEASQRLHRLEVQLARAQEAASAQEPPLFAGPAVTGTERLTQPVLVEAAVLGDAHAVAWRKGRWLDQGKSAGLWEDGPILAAASPLIDVGREARISAEDALLWGRAVIGKVHQVGRWTSTFLLVTDAEFRDRVQLVHETADGYVFGEKGILRGQGESLCRLEGIPASETVEIGDLVYTAGHDGLLPTPLYYGRVVEATLEDSAREWQVQVEPAERPDDLTTVHVLKTTLNARRLAN